MNTYARVLNGVVAELLSTALPLAGLFPTAMQWVDVSATPAVQVGWVALPSGGFGQPAAAAVPPLSVATVAGVQAQLTAIQIQITALQALVTGLAAAASGH